MTDPSLPHLSRVQPSLRWGRLLVWAFVIGLLVLLGIGVSRAQQGQVARGQKAPDFSVTAFPGTPPAGTTFQLSQAQGKIVVANFWASWCIPCREEAADLETVWQMYKDQGVVVVGIDWADTQKEAINFIGEFGQTYPNGPDLGTRAGQAYRIRGVPETYIINQQGILAWVKIGPTSLAELQSIVDPLLTKSSGN